jgi:hypothetical protein
LLTDVEKLGPVAFSKQMQDSRQRRSGLIDGNGNFFAQQIVLV